MLKKYPVETDFDPMFFSTKKKSNRTDMMTLKIYPMPNNYAYRNEKTYEYKNAFKKLEHLEFLSPRFLFALKTMIENNCISWGEIYSGTVCKNTRWCNLVELKEYADPHMERFGMFYEMKIDQYKSAACNPQDPLKNRWFHKVPFQFVVDVKCE